ncbi:MAG: LemA family protein [Elusimicrobiaceae bacterium]|nr:LemA family protein [Elusimicrobiaceae bacterium]
MVWFLFGFMCALVVGAIGAYFKFAALRKAVLQAKLRLDVQLKKRSDLIGPLALLATAIPELGKGFAYSLNQLKDREAFCDNLAKRVACEEDLSRTLHLLFETLQKDASYQHDAHFLHLLEETSQVEARIQRNKRSYNSAVRDFNTLTGVFPLNVWARLLDFESFEYFDFQPSTNKLL